ncbi:MAG TPA: DUF4065 domain-containing protein [Exilispira sp.]|nr:DUF4065 domain-containing protein [Exilispira sp.]
MVHIGKRIKELRERAGISQQKLANLLGVSRSTISVIENEKSGKLTIELAKKLSDLFNITIDDLLDPKKEIDIILKESKKGPKVKSQIRINVPQKKLDKFVEVFLYILNKVGSKPNIGETVIYKLLYFIDFDFYEKHEEQLIGATYIKNKYGPTPLEFKEIVKKLMNKDIIRLEKNYFTYPQTKYLPLRKPDLTKLKAHEVELIDDVLNRLSDMNAAQISEYSHNDVPWLTTEDGGIIEYEAVFYRTPPYSVREYTEDIEI